MKYKNYIKLAALLPLLALLGCEANEMPGAENQETVPVTIRLGLEKDGLSTRADDVHHTDALDEDESIHSLDIYILNEDGEVEAQLDLATDFSNNANTSATVQLTTGKKRVYAIANLPKASEEFELEDIQANQSVDAINEVTDEHQFVPMSADTTWHIESSQPTYTVNLIRMLAKMDVTIIDHREKGQETRASGNHKLTIKKLLPHETNLFRKAHGAIEFPDGIDFADWTWDEINYNDTENNKPKAHYDHFYLHESKPNEVEAFNLTLHDGEKERKGSFHTELYRNHYFPLIIHLTDYALAFSGSYELAPIGVEPFEIKITADGYTVELPEGCSNVDMKITLKYEGTEVTPTGNWTVTEGGDLDELKVSTENGLSITCDKLTALPIGTKTLHLTTTYDGKDLEFDVTIKVRELGNTEWTKSVNVSPEQPIIIEL